MSGASRIRPPVANRRGACGRVLGQPQPVGVDVGPSRCRGARHEHIAEALDEASVASAARGRRPSMNDSRVGAGAASPTAKPLMTISSIDKCAPPWTQQWSHDELRTLQASSASPRRGGVIPRGRDALSNNGQPRLGTDHDGSHGCGPVHVRAPATPTRTCQAVPRRSGTDGRVADAVAPQPPTCSADGGYLLRTWHPTTWAGAYRSHLPSGGSAGGASGCTEKTV